MRHVEPWRYFAEPEGVVDGDTIDVMVDEGFRDYTRERIRLLRVDTAETPPELKFPSTTREDLSDERKAEYSDALEQMAFVESWIREARRRHTPPVLVKTYQQRGSFNRYLAEIYRATRDGEDVETPSLNGALIDEYGDSVRYQA